MAKSEKEKEKLAGPDLREQKLIRTRTCALSNEALVLDTPVVADEIGNLFTKEAVITFLQEKMLPPEYEHIRGFRDVFDCLFHPNPDWAESTANGVKGDAVGGNYWTTDIVSPYICPITTVEMNGWNKFVVIRTTGFVLSERAVREVGIDALQQEYGPFKASDVIRLIPDDMEREDLIARMILRRELKASKKQKKKRKNAAAGLNTHEATEGTIDAQAGTCVPRAKKREISSKAVNVAGRQAARCASVLDETAKSIEETASNSAVYKNLFKGTGSQKPVDAHTQFILQAGLRYTLN